MGALGGGACSVWSPLARHAKREAQQAADSALQCMEPPMAAAAWSTAVLEGGVAARMS
jgi:hypothetical protein